jgi:hypothetical protein
MNWATVIKAGESLNDVIVRASIGDDENEKRKAKNKKAYFIKMSPETFLVSTPKKGKG